MTLNLDQTTTAAREIDRNKDQYKIVISFQVELPPCLLIPPFKMSPFVTDYLKIMFR